MIGRCWLLTVVSVLFFFFAPVTSAESQMEGQLSAWTILPSAEPRQAHIGMRYMPGIFVSYPGQHHTLSLECTLNLFATSQITSMNNASSDAWARIYRLWLRYSTPRFELRAGLQKITFGAASMLRPLMWFDRIDPRDPLNLTDGVTGFLMRYYFQGNANLWLWGLYGNDETKGWELLPTVSKTVEYGGRLQLPVGAIGEVAGSYHQRKVDATANLLSKLLFEEDQYTEHRVGLDTKWDMIIGWWAEASVTHRPTKRDDFKYQRLLTLGMDYTIGIGNGILVSGEYFQLATGSDWHTGDPAMELLAGSMMIPAGLFDTVLAMVYYDTDNHDLYRFVDWQRTYDRWNIHAIGFWNPDDITVLEMQQRNMYGGFGGQIMVVFNH